MRQILWHAVTSQLDFENRKYRQQTQANDHRANRTFKNRSNKPHCWLHLPFKNILFPYIKYTPSSYTELNITLAIKAQISLKYYKLISNSHRDTIP